MGPVQRSGQKTALTIFFGLLAGLSMLVLSGCSYRFSEPNPPATLELPKFAGLTPSEVEALATEIDFPQARDGFFKAKCMICHKETSAKAGVNFENFATLSEEVERGGYKVTRLYLVYLSVLQNEISQKLNVKKMPLGGAVSADHKEFLASWFQSLMSKVDIGQKQFEGVPEPPVLKTDEDDPIHLTLLAKSQRLRKLSLFTRGIVPDAKDFAELENVNSKEALQVYFDKKAAEYLKSSFAVRKIGERYLEHLRLPLLNEKLEFFGGPENFTLMDLLRDESEDFSDKVGFRNRIFSLIENGANWDELLAGEDSTYWEAVDPLFQVVVQAKSLIEMVRAQAMSEAGLAENASSDDLKAALQKYMSTHVSDATVQSLNAQLAAQPLLLQNSDLNFAVLSLDFSSKSAKSSLKNLIAEELKKPQYVSQVSAGYSQIVNVTPEKIFSLNGLLSAREVFKRFNKTRYSRSAAFFRIYMCDEMSPAVIIDNDQIASDALDGIHLPGGAVPGPATPVGPSEHLSPACITCHRKLDPIQDLVDGRAVLPNHQWKYDGSDGIERSEILNDKVEFYKQVFKTDQYVRCQAEKMWNWTIGRDVPLKKGRREEIEKKFNDLGRQPKAFIQYLTTLSEFYSEKVVTTPPTFTSVQPTLKRCTDCHSAGSIPNFSILPFAKASTTPETARVDHKEALKSLIRVTALDKKGLGATMPKRESNGVVIDWSLTERDREDLATWIWHLAQNESGEPTLTEAERDEIFSSVETNFILKISGPLVKNPSFMESWKRYLENYDMLYILRQKFPRSAGLCLKMKDANDTALALGFNDVASGLPNSPFPAVGFVSWTRKCYQTIVENELNPQNLMNWEQSYLGQLQVVPANFGGGDFTQILSSEWMNLESQHRSELVRRLANYLLESNSMNAASFEKLVAETIQRLDMLAQSPENAAGKVKVFEMIRAATHNLLSDERFTVF